MLSVANIYKTNKLGPTKSPWVYQVRLSGCANPWKLSLDHLHEEVRDDMLRWSKGFVVTGLGEAGADACTIMKITAHSSVTLSERYVHPTREGMEHAFERLQELSAAKAEEAMVEEAKVEAAAAGGASEVHTISTTVKKPRVPKFVQVVEIKARALSSAVRAADS